MGVSQSLTRNIVHTDDSRVCRCVRVGQEERDCCSLRDVHDRQPVLGGYQRKSYVNAHETSLFYGSDVDSLSSAEDAFEKLNLIPTCDENLNVA